jgi:pSer/pThr/pTyr-binding forkhead associated (FHA) protein
MTDLLLEIVEGAEAGRQHRLDGPLDIGRDAHMPLQLDDRQVSRRHARVTPADGRAWVEDLGSSNGTFVNEQLIHVPREIVPGDRIRMGLTVVELRTAQAVVERPSAVSPIPQELLQPVPQEVLRPVPEEQLAPVAPPPPPPPPPPPAAAPPAPPSGRPAPFRAPETPAAFVPPEVLDDEQARMDYEALQRLVDTRVKQRQNIAAFGLIGVSALAVILYFGLSG